MKGTAKDITVLTVGSVTRLRTTRLSQPTTTPMMTATTTEYRNVPAADHTENEAAVAAMAVRSITSALASFSRLSPSRMATARFDTGVCLMIDTATASVGLMMAPSATPQANPRSGSTY